MPDQEQPGPDPDEAMYDDPEMPDGIIEGTVPGFEPTEESYGVFDPSDLEEEAPVTQVDGDNPNTGAIFDPRYKDEFTGLLYLGSLSKSFTWMHHRFVIRTVGSDEALAIALVIQPWQGTLGEVTAYKNAAVAACIVTVDGQELPDKLTRDVTPEKLTPRFNYVKKNYPPLVVDMVYGELMKLEAKVAEILADMGKASG